MTPSELLNRLESDLLQLQATMRTDFFEKSAETLLRRPHPDAWSALDCFAHLNGELECYLLRLERAQHKAKARRWMPTEDVQSNWTGRRAIQSVDVQTGTWKAHRAHKTLNPLKTRPVRENEVKILLINLEVLIRLVRQSHEIDLNRPKIRPQYWSLAHFYMGDLLEYLTRHIQRHVLQAERSMAA